MTNRTRFLAVAFAVLCTAQARAGDDEPTDQVKLSATLAEVTSFPETYRRVPFELELLYHGPRELYNPYYTLFEPATYMNFAAWSADKAIWTRDGYVDDYPLFYVDRKTGVLEHQVVALKPFTWFTAKCIVKSTAQGRAWIEVLSITTTNTTLDRTDLRHLVKANVLASGGEFERALLEFSMAKMADAPARFVARYHVDQGRVALAANQPGRAMAELQAALPALPDDKELIALLDRATGNTTAPIAQPQVASAPTSVPPPLNLNGGARPAQKPNEPKRNDAPAIDPSAPKSEPAKTAAPSAIDPMPADAPKGDAAPAAKPQPAPKSDATDAPKTEPTPAAKTETPKVESKPEAKPQDPSGEKPAPSGDGAKPVETPAPKGEAPAPAPKPADAPEAKKDEAPAPSEPKPAETPEGKPGDAPAEKPENAPEEKPAEPPADKPKPDNGG